MKLLQAINNLGADNAIKEAKQAAKALNLEWEDGVGYVFKIIANDPARVPGNIGGKYDDELATVKKWLTKYKSGHEGRASKRASKPPGTIADPIIEQIIGARIPSLTLKELNSMSYAHRLGMSAENILGLMLEEFLANNLKEHGWYCAWGETVRSVDFVHENGALLQIKNRSNSENSSSSAIRDGTRIQKWYRIKAERVEYMWPALNEICGTSHLSEKAFINFVRRTLKNNPACLAVEEGNPWNKAP